MAYCGTPGDGEESESHSTPRHPIILGYQERWILDKSPVKVAEKSRRIGLSFCTALEAVHEADKGTSVWYIGYDEKMCSEFIQDCARWVEFAQAADDERTIASAVVSMQVRFTSGGRITALSSNPRTLRGKKGFIVVDEAAFHDDLAGIIKAAIAVTMWGGRVAIISTHYGANNPFCRLCDDIRNGIKDYSLHRISIDDALGDGLYGAICAANGVEEVPGGQSMWRKELFDDYGAYAQEELLCIPNRTNTQYFSIDVLMRSSTPNCTIVAKEYKDDLVFKTDADYQIKAQEVISQIPLPKKVIAAAIGVDIGRRSDITSIAIAHVYRPHPSDPIKFVIKDMVELFNAPYRLQEEVIHALYRYIGSVVGIAIDAIGTGNYLAEQITRTYGHHLVDSVNVNKKFNNVSIGNLRSCIEQGTVIIPRHENILTDFGLIETYDGTPTIGGRKSRTIDASTGQRAKRHGDSVISIALAVDVLSSKYIATTGEILLPNSRRPPTPHSRDAYADDDDRYSANGCMWF